MRKTGDQYLVKQINKGIVLETILRHSPISRADISAKVGLNKSTVSSLVQELMEERLVFETGPGQSSGGRKPVMLLFDGDAGFAVGVDLGVNDMQVILTDLHGSIRFRKSAKIDDPAPSVVIAKLISCIRETIAAAPSGAYGIIGIAVGVPGIVDSEGTVLTAPNLAWESVALKKTLNREFNVPVIVDNEANMGAIGEKTFGVAKHASNMIYISVGTGIGAGIVIHNELFRGRSGYSGEVGHMQIGDHHNLTCRCGNRGCWELYASENALLRAARESIAAEDGLFEGELELTTVVQMAKNGHPSAVAMFQAVGNALGIGALNLIHIFNPELVVIGGRIVSAEDLLLAPLKDTIAQHALPYHMQQLDIVFSDAGMPSCALGAASVILERFFTERKVHVTQ